MWIRILGSAAGGGLPQWNCRCENCTAARAGSAAVPPRTQSSVAISVDGSHWFLLNASADVRAQLTANGFLWPPEGAARGTTIAGCVLTDAEIDHASGLLQLREGCRFGVYSSVLVHRWLSEKLPIGPILAAFAQRPWTELSLEQLYPLPLADGSSSGLEIRMFEAGTEIPRFVGTSAETVGSRVALEIFDRTCGGKLVYAPGAGAVTRRLQTATGGAGCILLDGTFWTDDEPTRLAISDRTSTQMGHLPMSGPAGSLAFLKALKVPIKAYVHMNNTNPVLNAKSSERQTVEAAGVRVAMDGDAWEI